MTKVEIVEVEDIKPGALAFIKLTGEPVFVLRAGIPPADADRSIMYPQVLVRRFIQGRDTNTYTKDIFTEAELTLRNTQKDDLLKLLGVGGGDKIIEAEVLPEDSEPNKAGDPNIN